MKDEVYNKEIQNNVSVYTLKWIIPESNQDIPKQAGLYQLYGDSPIYGMNKLLYIGMTNDLTRREEEHTLFKGINGLSIRYALCPDSAVRKYLESLLIVTHKPSYNSQNVNDAPILRNGALSILYNEDERGALSLEVTSYWWCFE